MNEISDLWTNEEFEDFVVRGIVSQYETKIKKNRGAYPSDRLKEEKFRSLLSRDTPYVPSGTRDILAPADDGRLLIDIVNDGVPSRGCVFFNSDNCPEIKRVSKSSYATIFFFKRMDSGSMHIPKHWIRFDEPIQKNFFEFWQVDCQREAVEGERFFVGLSRDGEVVPLMGRAIFQSGYGQNIEIRTPHNQLLINALNAFHAFQFIADKRFCWSITAREQQASIELGCTREEVKSLLYARSLPVTDSGRKRPILHLVRAHKRRLKSGIEVDIEPFLRGERIVEINGTTFIVNPPEKNAAFG